MDGHQEWMSAEQMTPKQILAEGWRLTRAILALKGMEIPDTIHFQINRANQIRATRVATLEDLGKAIAALDEAIEHRSQDISSIKGLHRPIETEELKKERDALAELQKRAGRGGDPPSTTVIEALFPDLPVNKKEVEIEHWLAIRRRGARSTPRQRRSTGATRKPRTRMASGRNWSRRSPRVSAAHILPVPQGAKYGSSLEICLT
jgi:hypothetical protein